MENRVVVGALYEHYKGKQYRVLAIARHTETLELCVVYQSQYDDPQFGSGAIWVRPASMFTESVEIDGVLMPRFRQAESL